MMDYDKYLSMFDSDPEDDDDPDIKQLKYNALFAEEDGWIIVLPGFKPHRYQIQPVPPPPKQPDYVYDNGLEQHDQIVGSMKEMTLTMSGKDYYSSETLSAPQSPRRYTRKQQRSRVPSEASNSSKHSEPKQQETFEKRHIDEYNDYNYKISGKGNNNMKNPTKIIPRHENIMNVANGRRGVN